ncbi:MAG TPA: hypothetical protein VF669_23580 [Tepidisphaeraceae bacterium]|jgi:uncharacterized protein YdcH (DUF465 family)
MANDTVAGPRRAPHLAAMFQKAYAQAVMIQGIDEQINAMLEQREKLENEIHQMQTQLNDEFERMLSAAKRARLRLKAQISQPSPHDEQMENIKLEVTLPSRHRHHEEEEDFETRAAS